MNIIQRVVISVCCCLLMTGGFASAQQGNELEALQSYEGVWDCNFSIHPADKQGEARSFTGVVEGKWVVGGKFMEQTGKYRLSETAPPLVIRTMMGFDREKKEFVYHYFLSTGDTWKSKGAWDAGAKTMTSEMRNEKNGNVTRIIADFSTPDIETWVIETRNRDGQSTGRITGTNTRRQKS